MATKTTNYQCPACTGPLHFDSKTGRLTCDYCGSSYDVKEIEARYAAQQASADAAAEADARKAAQQVKTEPDAPLWSEAEAAALNSYTCPSCGAELVCGTETAATNCPVSARSANSRRGGLRSSTTASVAAPGMCLPARR